MISTRFGGLAFGRAGWVGVDGRLRDPFFFIARLALLLGREEEYEWQELV
jgi:hypothetical protein